MVRRFASYCRFFLFLVCGITAAEVAGRIPSFFTLYNSLAEARAHHSSLPRHLSIDFSGHLRENIKSIELTFVELKKAFQALVEALSEGVKICLIVNGIDEYKGDHDEVTKLFAAFSDCERVKVILSSRPIPACVCAFSSFPNLRLQDLNHHDISEYVQDNLCGNVMMQRMDCAQKGVAGYLMEEITLKACGVFLWVVLVVRRILGCLQDYDTMADLMQVVDELPPHVETPYKDMLGKMNPRRRRQGSMMLQVVLRSLETHGHYPLTLLQLSIVEEQEHVQAIRLIANTACEKDLEWCSVRVVKYPIS